jgi:hypothetical protein
VGRRRRNPSRRAIARITGFRSSFKTKVEQRIDALDTYCGNGRRPFADVSGFDCEALVDNRHLIGGDQAVRAKRKPAATPPPGAKPVKRGTYSRYRLKAYVVGVEVLASTAKAMVHLLSAGPVTERLHAALPTLAVVAAAAAVGRVSAALAAYADDRIPPA